MYSVWGQRGEFKITIILAPLLPQHGLVHPFAAHRLKTAWTRCYVIKRTQRHETNHFDIFVSQFNMIRTWFHITVKVVRSWRKMTHESRWVDNVALCHDKQKWGYALGHEKQLLSSSVRFMAPCVKQGYNQFRWRNARLIFMRNIIIFMRKLKKRTLV